MIHVDHRYNSKLWTPMEPKSSLSPIHLHDFYRPSSRVALMSLQDEFEEDAAWAAAAPAAPGDILRDSMKKEVIVK
jgi:hypothetical protein